MSKPRFQVEMSEDQSQLLDELMADAGLSSKRDLFNSALALFFWAVERSKEGRAIASIAPDGTSLRELEMPSLLALREAGRRKLKEEAKAADQEPSAA